MGSTLLYVHRHKQFLLSRTRNIIWSRRVCQCVVTIGHFYFSQSKRDKNHELWTIQAGHSNGPTAGEADAVSVSSTVNSAYQQ